MICNKPSFCPAHGSAVSVMKKCLCSIICVLDLVMKAWTLLSFPITRVYWSHAVQTQTVMGGGDDTWHRLMKVVVCDILAFTLKFLNLSVACVLFTPLSPSVLTVTHAEFEHAWSSSQPTEPEILIHDRKLWRRSRFIFDVLFILTGFIVMLAAWLTCLHSWRRQVVLMLWPIRLFEPIITRCDPSTCKSVFLLHLCLSSG